MTRHKTSPAERLIAASLFALMVGLTALCFPIGLMLLTRGRALVVLHLFSGFWHWWSAIVVAAVLLGLVVGPERSTELLGHFWGTERPRRIGVTLALWVGSILVGIVGYWCFSQMPM